MYMPHYLHITAYGEVVHNPPNPQGLVIVSEVTHVPLLLVSEVSDSQIINLFVNAAEGKALQLSEIDDLPEGTYEVLVNQPE